MRDSELLKDQMLDPVGEDALRRIESRLMRSLDTKKVQATSRHSRGAMLGVGATALAVAAAFVGWGALSQVDHPQSRQARREQVTNTRSKAVSAVSAHAAATDVALEDDTPTRPEGLRLASGELLVRGVVSFDRSRVEFHGGGAVEAQEASALHVQQNDAEKTEFEVNKGQLLFDMPSDSAQAWTVITPQFSVLAAAASFVVERDGDRARVVVKHGEATVKTRDGKSLRLVAGDSYAVPEAKEIARFVTRPPASDEGVPQVRFEDVDRARARGDIAGAISHLRELAKHGSVHQRSLAQFTLGKLLHERGDVDAARDALQKAKSLADSGPLAGAIERRLEQLEAISTRKP